MPYYCKVVTRKKAGSFSVLCGTEAAVLLRLTGEDDDVLEAAPVCKRHAKEFEQGKSLIVEYGADDHVLVRAVESAP